jgi:N utilization substance protein A
VEKLGAAGVTTVEALADMTPEQLEAIEGIGPKTVEKISLAVNNYFASLEGGEVVAELPEGEALPGQEGAVAEDGSSEMAEGAPAEESSAETEKRSREQSAGEGAAQASDESTADEPSSEEHNR